MTTFFNILVADTGLSADPAFKESVFITFRSDSGFIGFNIAGQRGKLPVYGAGPMSLGPFLAVLLSVDDYHELTTQKLINTELLSIADSGYCIAFATGEAAQRIDELMGEKVMLLNGHGGWDADQLREEITERRWWQPTKASLAELIAVPAAERWALACQKRLARTSFAS